MIHLFNPENDLALGLGCRNYTPPPHAAALHRAGALLPFWWAEDGDSVIVPEPIAGMADDLCREWGLRGKVYDGERDIASPWGWSLDAKRQLCAAGVGSQYLPTDERIEQMRNLSHRRTSIEILARLGEEYPRGIEFTDPLQAVEMEMNCRGCYVKSPWSGSGRGVFCASSLSREALHSRVAGIINRQGSVILEPGLDKVMDFAALFYGDGERVSFRGWSVFETESRGMYVGNIVAPQQHLVSMITDRCDGDELWMLVGRLESILSGLTRGVYRGWMGIDMMVYKDGGNECRIMPCVELNLRMTMGVVAMKIAERLCVNDPHLLAWSHNAPAEGTILLPPAEGFTLSLAKMVL